MTDLTHTAQKCPLCGGDNQCAIAAGRPAQSCWCQNTNIDPKAKIAAAASAATRCLCPACGLPTGGAPNAR